MLKLFEIFAENSHFDYDNALLKVPVKFRDQLQFKGKKVDYDKFTTFVLKEGQYVPLMFVPDAENLVTINMYPLISIGMAELLSTSCQLGDASLSLFESALFDEDVLYSDFEHYKNYCDFVHFDQDNFENNKGEISVVLSLRSDYTNCQFERIRRLSSLMIACYHSNPKTFCEFLLESMKFIYSTCSLWTTPIEKLASVRADSGDVGMFNMKELISLSYLNPKKIGYTVPDGDKKHYISNCRGLAIYAYLILFFSVYKHFGVANSSLCADIGIGNKNYEDYIQEKFKECIGDDYVGRYYKSGKARLREYNGVEAIALHASGNIGGSSANLYTLSDGKKVVRDIYENEILFRRANKVTFTKVTDGLLLRNASTYYTSIFYLDGLFHSAVKFKAIKDEACQNALDKVGVNKEITSIPVKEHLARVAELGTKYNEELNKLNSSYETDIEDYKKKIEEYERLLSSKTDIITNLTSELKDVKAQLLSYYSEDDDDIVVLDDFISLEDAVDYINQFTTILVGGRYDILTKLESIGWTNVKQVSDQNLMNSTPSNADFFCMNTKFISHKLVRVIESKYENQKSQMFYYNGTNIENLVYCTYNFIRKWVES